jgi:hypothetical protein
LTTTAGKVQPRRHLRRLAHHAALHHRTETAGLPLAKSTVLRKSVVELREGSFSRPATSLRKLGRTGMKM